MVWVKQNDKYNNTHGPGRMDCYIVRIYRRMASKDGQGNEIAGLVEKVGDAGEGRAFSSCQDLVNSFNGAPLSEEPNPLNDAAAPSGVVVRIAPDIAGS